MISKWNMIKKEYRNEYLEKRRSNNILAVRGPPEQTKKKLKPFENISGLSRHFEANRQVLGRKMWTSLSTAFG